MTAPSLKFSANLGFLWADRPLPDAIHAAAAAGFDAVECHWPYDHDPALVRDALQETGLPMVGLNTYSGENGMFGLTAVPDKRDQARDAILASLDYAAETSTRFVHVMAGCAEGEKAHQVFLENLNFACQEAAQRNIGILIEPINTKDRPGYFLNKVDHAAAIISSVNHPSLKLMFDCYHCAMMNDDVITMIETHLSIMGHIQFAGVPDRGRPDVGVLDYGPVFASLQGLGWSGYLGAEYIPDTTHRYDATDQSLGWMASMK